MAKAQARKQRISVTVDPKLLAWVKARVGAGKPFGTVSHAVESGIVALQEQESR